MFWIGVVPEHEKMTSFENNSLAGLKMNEARFISLLSKLVGESRYLQNNPSQGLIPKEELACNHLMDALRPYMVENGGVLEVQKIGIKKPSYFFNVSYRIIPLRLC
jgi:hypothetical protein